LVLQQILSECERNSFGLQRIVFGFERNSFGLQQIVFGFERNSSGLQQIVFGLERKGFGFVQTGFEILAPCAGIERPEPATVQPRVGAMAPRAKSAAEAMRCAHSNARTTPAITEPTHPTPEPQADRAGLVKPEAQRWEGTVFMAVGQQVGVRPLSTPMRNHASHPGKLFPAGSFSRSLQRADGCAVITRQTGAIEVAQMQRSGIRGFV
jgi:hypothetical protein